MKTVAFLIPMSLPAFPRGFRPPAPPDFNDPCGRTSLSNGGNRTEGGKAPRLLATPGDREELGGYVGDDATKARKSGLVGFELEGFGRIGIRNIRLKRL